MLSRRFALLVMTWFVLFAQSAQAFFDPPWITPENPKAGETVYVNIHGGICNAIFEESGYPQITREGNAIRIRWYGVHWPEGSGDLQCIYPVGTFVPPIGVFTPGDYTLTVELAYIDYFEGPSIFTIGVVPFTIAAPLAPVSVPSLGMLGVLTLLAMLLGIALVSLRTWRATWLVVALVVLPWDVRAQDTGTIRILLSDAPCAPTTAVVVAWANSSPRVGTPPLTAFTVKNWVRGAGHLRLNQLNLT